jgi:hypothetical protein
MIKRISVILVLSVFVAFIFAGGAFGTTAKGKTTRSFTAEPIAAPIADAPPPIPYKYTPHGGISYKTDCSGIAPEAGAVIEHTQIGDTWYDFQKNGSMGRMISVTSGGYRHVSWMYTNAVYPGTQRYVYGVCEPTGGPWNGVSTVDGGATNAGYSNQTHLSDGTSLVIYHRTAGSPTWNSAIAIDAAVCGGFFNRHYDLPDSIVGALSANPMMWPKGEVQHDTANGGRDYLHVVGTEGNTAGGAVCVIAYERCYFSVDRDTLICQSYWGGSTKTYKMFHDVYAGTLPHISPFDSSCSITPVVAVSKVSKRVAIAFMRPADPAGTCDHGGDVNYIESMNLGNDWINGTNWPAQDYNITNYGGGSGDKAFSDLSACYDFQDSLHIIWVATDHDATQPGTYTPSDARLYHWSKKAGISIVAQQSQPYATNIAGAHNSWISKPSISSSDSLYHPGTDSVYLWVTWTQFDTLDIGADGYGNGDIFGSASNTGGATWAGKYNLTNTKTPGCASGTCVSESWSSAAQNMYNGHLHLEYICDKDPGGAINAQGAWLDNPVYYLELSQWLLQSVPGISVKVLLPETGWYKPPLKVLPGGTRTLKYKVYSIGNGNLVINVTSDNSCIDATAGPISLAPRDSATLTATIYGTGTPCNHKFISGNITITSNDPSNPSIGYPVQAVADSHYYECPNDPVTSDTLKNGILNFYVNANGQEWVHDTSFATDTTHDVFFQGGPFVATKINGDTLVGRFYGENDQHALAQDSLSWTSFPDFWLDYSYNVAIHKLNPPVDTLYWWFDMLHENVFFKPTASSDLKHTVIKFVTVERHNPPGWWPTHQTFTNYEDTYVGMMMDIDCPFDTQGTENGRNTAGYDVTNNIAWQKGWNNTGPHPEYNNYYAGIALAQGYQPGESVVPWGTYNLMNHTYLYPQSPWGWKEGQFYTLAAGNTVGAVQYSDSIVDRSQIVTARKIAAGNDANMRVSFTVIEAVGPTGLSDLQAKVAAARAWIASKPFILCGDANNSGVVEVGDIVTLINYLYKSGTAPIGPFFRGDANSSGVVEVGDIVTLICYLYKLGVPPKCSGVW